MTVENISREKLSERAMGQFPISIATSLAIESLVGILPEAPTDSPEIFKRDLLLINIRTLIRNLLGSVDKEARALLEEYTMAEAVSNEMRVIEEVISETSDGRCEVKFYHCTYGDIPRRYKQALLKGPTTTAQHMYWAQKNLVIKNLLTQFESGTPIEQWTTDFPDFNYKTVLLTHYPVDLLQRYRFQSLALLESHTGAIKTPLMWNTKLVSGKEHPNLPFDKMTLQMFGDGILFSPMPIKIRKRVLELAETYKWTPATTKALIIDSAAARKDPALEMLIKDLYSA
ncbi:hypothetical protein D3C85_429230 [compost metagenome]